MSDLFTRFIADKLTQSQKRGYAPAKASTREMHNDRRVIDAPRGRTLDELRCAREQLAVLALDHPDLDTDEQRERWLFEVLEMMGLLEIQERRKDEGQACWPYNGTVRGYDQHLRTYTRTCGDCESAHQVDLAGRLSALGITDGGDVKWT